MKRLVFIFLMLLSYNAFSQGAVVGKWKSVDESSGEARSIVEISEKNGMLYGKVIKIFVRTGEDPDPVCNNCEKDDPRFQKKVIGMEIVQGLHKSGESYTGGEILDPENGKVYRCKMWIEDNALKVRGYLGPFYRTQTWQRVVVSK